MFDALVQSHASLDIPLIVLSAEQLDAPQLGELFYFLELTAALCAASAPSRPEHRPLRACKVEGSLCLRFFHKYVLVFPEKNWYNESDHMRKGGMPVWSIL